jgi:hypothetical protein
MVPKETLLIILLQFLHMNSLGLLSKAGSCPQSVWFIVLIPLRHLLTGEPKTGSFDHLISPHFVRSLPQGYLSKTDAIITIPLSLFVFIFDKRKKHGKAPFVSKGRICLRGFALR